MSIAACLPAASFTVMASRTGDQAPADLDPDRIAEAAGVIDPVFLDSPQYVDPVLARELGRRLVVKVETTNPLRSFKGRGAEHLLHRLTAERGPGLDLVCSSTGNFGQAITWAARRRGHTSTVFVPAATAPVKLHRMTLLGADVVAVDGDGDGAEQAAVDFARSRSGALLVEDGREPAIAEGAGTIGRELTRRHLDTIVVPVGDGALITGIGAWTRRHAPGVRVVGVCAAGAPCMAQSWRRGEPVGTARADTVAEGIAVRTPVPESVARMRVLVHDMVLVSDDDLAHGADLIRRTLGIVPELAGAAGLAALLVHDLPGEVVATVLTGANT